MTWYPIASASDLSYRTTYHAQILGRELVAWRADDDTVNVWENRCLHRGVRLSRGLNDGAELVCQYHGWRYSNRTAGCTYIPAHPADAPARTICNRTYPVVERYGLVWSSVDVDVVAEPVPVPILETGRPLTLRPIPVDAPPVDVADALLRYRFLPTTAVAPRPRGAVDWRSFRADDHDSAIEILGRSELALTVESSTADAVSAVVFWVQPVDAHRAVIRGVLDHEPTGDHRLVVLRHHNERLTRLRDEIEVAAAARPAPAPIEVELEPVSEDLASMPPRIAGRSPQLRVRVHRKWQTAADVMGFDLRPLESTLPTFQPGAHIDVHLPNGLVRQYSLTNGPGELDRYRIGVKREPYGRGGSIALHDSVREGDVLAISEPRNNFTLRRDSERTVLLAGGIGITPLLAMAQALHRSDLGYELHLFARTRDHMPFAELTDRLGARHREHLALSPDQTGAAIRDILGGHTHSAHVYVCGPGPMIAATTAIAADLGWPEDSVNFEYFANESDIDDSTTFEIDLARSALTLEVGAGQTILEVLRSNGVTVASSCEQGACGTCIVPVLAGEPHHQDVYLRPGERESGDRILTCVSRAATDRLVLDI